MSNSGLKGDYTETVIQEPEISIAINTSGCFFFLYIIFKKNQKKWIGCFHCFQFILNFKKQNIKLTGSFKVFAQQQQQLEMGF